MIKNSKYKLILSNNEIEKIEINDEKYNVHLYEFEHINGINIIIPYSCNQYSFAHIYVSYPVNNTFIHIKKIKLQTNIKKDKIDYLLKYIKIL